jgi:hypothetical protein
MAASTALPPLTEWDMVNGKVGDHPLTDILIHRLAIFTPEIDDLIVQLDQYGYWENQLLGFLMLGLPEQIAASRVTVGEDAPETFLGNLEIVLRDELARVSGTPQ